MKKTRQKPLPDFLNPIFVLSERKTLSLIWNHPIGVSWFLGGVFILAVVVRIVFFPVLQEWQINPQDIPVLRRIILGGVVLLTWGVSLGGSDKFAKRTTDRDPLHYTAMSRGEIVSGYFHCGLFRLGSLTLLGVFVCVVLFFPDFSVLLESFLIFLLAFDLGITVCLFTLSWSVIVSEPVHNVLAGITMVMTVITFFVCGIAFPIVEIAETSDIFVAVFLVFLCCGAFSLVALGLMRSGLSRNIPFAVKYAINLVVYMVVFAILAGCLFFCAAR